MGLLENFTRSAEGAAQQSPGCKRPRQRALTPWGHHGIELSPVRAKQEEPVSPLQGFRAPMHPRASARFAASALGFAAPRFQRSAAITSNSIVTGH
jgi:hypothetical protein